MRTRKEIEDEYLESIMHIKQSDPRPLIQVLEILLDIRDLLTKKE